jgi:hypothetical protein
MSTAKLEAALGLVPRPSTEPLAECIRALLGGNDGAAPHEGK